MEKLEKLYEGKAKQLYATDDPEVLWVEYKNSATAGDGEKKEDFAGKGRLNNLITTLIFDLLKKRGIDSHLVPSKTWEFPCRRNELRLIYPRRTSEKKDRVSIFRLQRAF